MSRRKIIGIAGTVSLGLIAVGVWWLISSPADKDPFLVGLTRDTNGELTVMFVQCAGGELEHIHLAIDRGDDNADHRLWAIDADPTTGPELDVGTVKEIPIGAAPISMTETMLLTEDLPSSAMLQINVDTSRQDFGAFFHLGDVVDGKVFTDVYGLLNADTFGTRAKEQCGAVD